MDRRAARGVTGLPSRRPGDLILVRPHSFLHLWPYAFAAPFEVASPVVLVVHSIGGIGLVLRAGKGQVVQGIAGVPKVAREYRQEFYTIKSHQAGTILFEDAVTLNLLSPEEAFALLV